MRDKETTNIEYFAGDENGGVIIDYIRRGYTTAAIDSSFNSNLAYRPEFVSNDHSQGRKVLTSIEKELLSCDEFMISVAFITQGGIQALLGTFKELEEKKIPGKILTTDYQFFTEPKALEKLAGLKNIELKMYETSGQSEGFHTKGYIFREKEIYKIIIGSSNMTSTAITVNAEWNTRIVSTGKGQMAQDVLGEFDTLWNSSCSKSFEQFYEHYREEYTKHKLIRKQHAQALKEAQADFEIYTLKPNKMQTAFVNNLSQIVREHKNKAMLLSSTGTGKTLASAFAARELAAERILFVVHREQIAKQARESFKRVFGSSKTYGLISGNSREMDGDITFATMQMMSKQEIFEQFPSDAFQMIILDECHHSGSESYRRIMGYFKPALWLGMTASPDTNNYDVYSIFDHNIAYEIRLKQALEEDLLCPFHYYGITDLQINGRTFDDQSGVRNFSDLVCDKRIEYVIEKANYYGFSGTRRKAIVFCSRKDEARELAAKFTSKGYRSACLLGEDSQSRREEVIDFLTDDSVEESRRLEFIFTVDIFNEGVDVPEINQVIMLRPTQSPVVFIQQLGRGLRKFPDKEYVVILDFIGNYMNNFMIPIALSGDRSYNKDTMRRHVQEGSRVIPGESSIYFDRISRERIYKSIDAARTTDLKLIRESYTALKYKLGRIPRIADFKKFGSIDIRKIFDKCGSYYNFLKKYEPEYNVALSAKQQEVIEYLSKKMTGYKRIYEAALLEYLLKEGSCESDSSISGYGAYLKDKYALAMDEALKASVRNNLTNEFPLEKEKNKYSHCVLIKTDAEGGYALSDEFEEMLKDADFRLMVTELADFAVSEYEEKYSERYRDTDFVLYQKYNYEDVCRLLCWRRNTNAQNIGGYFYHAETKTLPVFINYHKAEDAIAYEDRFEAENSLIALSKHPRKITSADATHIYKNSKEDRDNRIYLFVRKNKDDNEAKEFYFLGEVQAVGSPHPIHMETTNDDAFEIHYKLDVPVRTDIYDYITGE